MTDRITHANDRLIIVFLKTAEEPTANRTSEAFAIFGMSISNNIRLPENSAWMRIIFRIGNTCKHSRKCSLCVCKLMQSYCHRYHMMSIYTGIDIYRWSYYRCSAVDVMMLVCVRACVCVCVWVCVLDSRKSTHAIAHPNKLAHMNTYPNTHTHTRLIHEQAHTHITCMYIQFSKLSHGHGQVHAPESRWCACFSSQLRLIPASPKHFHVCTHKHTHARGWAGVKKKNNEWRQHTTREHTEYFPKTTHMLSYNSVGAPAYRHHMRPVSCLLYVWRWSVD